MKWTKEKPTKEGDYLFKGDIVMIKDNLKLHTFRKKIIIEVSKSKEDENILYKVRGNSIIVVALESFSGYWSDQPIPEPEEADK